MKRIVMLLLMISICFILQARELSLGVNLLSFDSLYYDNVSIKAEAGYKERDLRVSLSSSYLNSLDNDNDIKIINISLSFDHYPFTFLPFYIGAALLDLNLLSGIDAPNEKYNFQTNIRLGFDINIFNVLSLDARLCIYDSSFSSFSFKQRRRNQVEIYIFYKIIRS